MRPIYKYYHNFIIKEDCEYLIQSNIDKLESAKVANNTSASKFLRKGKTSWINNNEDIKSTEIIQKIVDLMFWESKFTHNTELSTVESVQFAKYGFLDHYDKHIDIGTDGNYRVLTAVVELSDPKNYIGGGLNLYMGRHIYKIPFKQGTVVIFPSIITHKAKPVFYSSRYSITLWGLRD